ncbi:MAG: BolA/IbaG family iron-sulfur metabolism protein [Deltaproteobacteria bacterium]|nr:BolA/IbaG family iron-sulfur metabolism protein [Deltaproteobacteria bacterium]
MTKEEFENRIIKALPNAKVEAKDMTGGGDHFSVQVSSDKFKGKTLVEQHQIINQIFEEDFKGTLHALSIQTFIPK